MLLSREMLMGSQYFVCAVPGGMGHALLSEFQIQKFIFFLFEFRNLHLATDFIVFVSLAATFQNMVKEKQLIKKKKWSDLKEKKAVLFLFETNIYSCFPFIKALVLYLSGQTKKLTHLTKIYAQQHSNEKW